MNGWKPTSQALPWDEIVAKQSEIVSKCRSAEDRHYEYQCLMAMRLAAAKHQEEARQAAKRLAP